MVMHRAHEMPFDGRAFTLEISRVSASVCYCCCFLFYAVFATVIKSD